MSSRKSRIEKLEAQLPKRPVTIPLEERGLQIDGVLFKYPQLKAMNEAELSQWGAASQKFIKSFLDHASYAPGYWYSLDDTEVPIEIVPSLGWRFMQVIIPKPRTDD